jgi:hypothetical protein
VILPSFLFVAPTPPTAGPVDCRHARLAIAPAEPVDDYRAICPDCGAEGPRALRPESARASFWRRQLQRWGLA